MFCDVRLFCSSLVELAALFDGEGATSRLALLCRNPTELLITEFAIA